jgi:hypothetical protein
LNNVSYRMRINYGKSSKLYNNSFANPNNLHDDDYTLSFDTNPVESILLVMQQSAFRGYMSYNLANDFINDWVCFHSEVTTCDWWSND